MATKIIIKDVAPVDWVLAIRAARWLLDRPDTDSVILAYGESADYDKLMHFYAKRNKSSITVRPC
jgi:hypothetical protein